MTPAELLVDCFERVRESVDDVLDGLGDDDLVARPAAGANTIAWLVWHLTRVEDDHVADVAGREQLWTANGFAGRFALPFDDAVIQYRMAYRYPPAAVRRLDDALLTAYGDRYVALSGNAHRRVALEARLEKLVG